MKKVLFLLFYFSHLSIVFSQEVSKKNIKEAYTESIDSKNHKDFYFKEYNQKGEEITYGNWIKDSLSKKPFKKTKSYKIETEKEYKYVFDKNNNIISKTSFYKESKYIKHFAGQIKSHEILLYNYKNNLFKSTSYNAIIDTTDSGREFFNEDPKAYLVGIKNIGVEYLSYDLKMSSIKKYNEEGQLILYIDLYDNSGIEYFYNNQGVLESYTEYNLKNEEISLWGYYQREWEDKIIQDKNIVGEYSIQYKYDEYGNWIEKTTYNDKYINSKFYKKEIRNIVYY